MTAYTVGWDPAAEHELGDIYLDADDPNLVTAASAKVDYLLAQDPIHYGQLLSEGLYRIYVSPLLVFYTVDVNRKHAQVTNVYAAP
jgi:hypothetical protein